MKKSFFAIVTLSAISSANAASPDELTVTLQNQTGATANDIQVRAEAFSFDVSALAPGESVTNHVHTRSGNCGVAVSFTVDKTAHKTGAGLILRDAPVSATTVRLQLTGLETLEATSTPTKSKSMSDGK